jgi:hypothetical protein
LSLTPSSLLPQARALAHRHRRGIVAGAAALLAGFGISAVAIAPLAPDAADLPQQLVSQAVEPHALDTQLESLALHDLALVRNDITRSTDSVDSLLSRLGVTDSSAAAFLRSDLIARGLVTGRGGKMVQAQTSADGSLVELVARYPAIRSEVAGTHFTRLTVARVDGRWTALTATVPMQSRPRLAGGHIESSLFAATDAAGLPETWFTVWSNVMDRGHARPGETILIHGGTSGIGITALQLAQEIGLNSITTCGSDEKCAAARMHGAGHAINYRTQDFAAETLAFTGSRGVNIVLDMVGGDYVPKNTACLADDGRHVSIAFQRGPTAEVNLGLVMRKRLVLTGSMLRPRPIAFKTAIAETLEGLRGIELVKFKETDVVRHPLVSTIVSAYAEKERQIPLRLEE